MASIYTATILLKGGLKIEETNSQKMFYFFRSVVCLAQ